MARLLISPKADELLTSLESTPARTGLLGALNSALDILELDTADVRCRRRRFSNIGCWAIPVEAEGALWLILWEHGDEASVIVRAIVRAP
ncbi:MAG: hypothetical protein ACYC5Z_05840 [Acidimicrobiales bacterium]